MLFQSQAEQLITRALKAAVDQADRQRKEQAQKQLAFYENEFESYIRDYLNKNYINAQARTALGVNVVRKIVRNLAMVYNKDAKRSIEGSEADQAIFAEIETSASLAVAMKQVNRLSKLLGTLLLRPVWRGEKMELDVLTPDILDVVWGDTPSDLLEVIVTRNDPDGQASAVTFSRWTAETFQRLDYRGQILEEYPNPYGRPPFIPIWAEPPLDNFWLPGANDLVMVQEAINAILTDLLFTLRLQSCSIFYIKGSPPGERMERDGLTIGPGKVIFLPEKADIGFASPNAPIDEALTAIETLMRQAAVTNGLSASSVNLKPSEESGRAKLVGNAELEEMRADDLALFAKYEDQLFDLFRTVWNAHNPTRILSPAAVLWCEFYHPEPSQTPFEKTRNWRELLDMGIMSKVDILMALNPDLDREQAVSQLQQTQEEIKLFSDEPVLPPSLSYFRPSGVKGVADGPEE